MRALVQSNATLRLVASLVVALGILCAGHRANAQESVSDPWRVMGLVSVGVPLRVTRRAELGQDTLAPAFVDANAWVLLPGAGALRHGPLLGLSTNLTIDGGFYAPVEALSQWFALVGYAGRYALNEDFFAMAHVAVPFDLGGSGSVGFELSGALGYRVLSGFGAFAELSGDVFGGEGGANVIASIEFGLFVDYEVLP